MGLLYGSWEQVSTLTWASLKHCSIFQRKSLLLLLLPCLVLINIQIVLDLRLLVWPSLLLNLSKFLTQTHLLELIKTLLVVLGPILELIQL